MLERYIDICTSYVLAPLVLHTPIFNRTPGTVIVLLACIACILSVYADVCGWVGGGGGGGGGGCWGGKAMLSWINSLKCSHVG
jgi:hypothetical protein